MFEVKPKLSSQRIRQHIAADDTEALRESQQRREYLEALAIMNAGEQVYVQIAGDSAYADIADKDSQLGYTDRTIINVRADIPEQVTTQIDEEVWDFLVQKTDLYHELGHVKWTDWPSFEEVLEGDDQGNYGVVEEHRLMFKVWSDYMEDAVIERYLIDRYDIQDDLRVTNDNLLRANPPDKTVSLNSAVTLRLMEEKHPIGWFDQLVDENDPRIQFLTEADRDTFKEEILPAIEELLPDILNEPDGAERHYKMYEMYERIGIYFDDSVKPGFGEDLSYDFPSDHDNMGDMSAQQAPQTQQDPQSGQPQPDPVPDPPDPPDPSKMSEDKVMDVDKQEDYSNQVQRQKDAMGVDRRVDSYEKWARVIDQEYDDGTTMSLYIPGIPPADANFDPSRYQEAEQLSVPLATDLRQRLQQQRRTKKQRKKKSGKVDSKRAHKTKEGKTDVFKRTADPQDKDYSCIIVVDRSGSMTGELEAAETAAGALALALEDVGISVAQLSMLRGKVQLEKDPADDVDMSKERMFRDQNGGGTPLSDALMMAKARLDQSAQHPFAIVITDGEPDHRERYRDTLHSCNFPVLGVYIRGGGSFDESHTNEAQYFHKLELRHTDDVFDGVQSLVKGVMF